MRTACCIFFTLFFFRCFSQTIYVPYRFGKLWGLADTSGKIVLTPKFDKLDYEENRNSLKSNVYFISEKDKKKGVIRGKIEIIPTIYDEVLLYDNYIVCTNKEAGHKNIWLYTINGKKLNNSSFISFKDFADANNNDYIQMFIAQSNTQTYNLGYIDCKNSKLNFLLEDAYFIETIFSTDFLSFKKDAKSAKKLFKIIQLNPTSYSISFETENKNESSAGKTKSMVSSSSNSSPFPPSGGYEFKKSYGMWNSYYNYKINKDIRVDFVYDTVYEAFSSLYGYEFEVENKSIKYNNILICKKNGLLGLLFPDGKKVEPAFDDIRIFEYDNSSYYLKSITKQIFFQVKKACKLGIINQNGKYVLPIEYESIDPNLIVSKNRKFGILNFNGVEVFPLVCDSIYFHDFKYYLQSDKKFGIIGYSTYYNSIVRMDCISPNFIKDFDDLTISKPKSISYIVFKAEDSNKKFIGYFDSKGFAYFK